MASRPHWKTSWTMSLVNPGVSTQSIKLAYDFHAALKQQGIK